MNRRGVLAFVVARGSMWRRQCFAFYFGKPVTSSFQPAHKARSFYPLSATIRRWKNNQQISAINYTKLLTTKDFGAATKKFLQRSEEQEEQ